MPSKRVRRLFYLMRKICLYSLLCLGLISIYSCSQNQKRVQTFADTFVGYVNGDQLDSIRSIYPTANFDSVSPLNSDSIQIAETDGVYHIDFGSTKWIEVKENEDGTFTIENSKGITAFPEDKYNIAVNTGMLNDSISDTKAQELLNDSTYFAWLNEKVSKELKESLKFSRGMIKTSGGEPNYNITWPVTVTNKGNSTINGSSYYVATRWYSYWGDGRPGKGTPITIKGEDLAPGETKTFTFKQKAFALNPPTLEYNLSSKELLKLFKPTGKEYQEYLDSKK